MSPMHVTLKAGVKDAQKMPLMHVILRVHVELYLRLLWALELT